MAVYRVLTTRQIPIRYLASGGAEADHTVSEDDLAREEGNPNALAQTWKLVGYGAIAYTEADDALDGATYSPFPAFFKEHERLGGVEETDASQLQSEAEELPEPASSSSTESLDAGSASDGSDQGGVDEEVAQKAATTQTPVDQEPKATNEEPQKANRGSRSTSS